MSEDLSLFGEPDPREVSRRRREPAGRPAHGSVPLAERMRPRTLDEVVGQEHLVGPGGTLRRLVRAGHLPNLILHGPPGSGKTTLARAIAEEVDAAFVPFSAVSEGVPRLREIVKEAEQLRRAGRGTLLFIDEIHRLNKGQQDFLLPFIESGLLVLIGATTEHPGFEINPAVLSRSRVLVLEPLRPEEVCAVVRRALQDPERGLGGLGLSLDPEAEELLVRATGGDARQALTGLEIAARLAGPGATLTEPAVREALQQRTDRYDATLAYEMLSAFHKSLRTSDGDAALYWAMRMIRGGEDPKTLFRRMVAMAYEDVGLADPQAGVVAVQAMQAFERLGMPEGQLPLANAILYLATAPKSNHAYLALYAAMEAVETHPDAPVPLHLRNATTGLMKEWGYGKGYRYAHDYEGAAVEQQCLPDVLAGARFYEPSDRGFEREVAARIAEREGKRRPEPGR
ncbi:MAG TPA: replication-associated recombination protein A [Longimicrobiaceae bacterium]|nr:replication-associated recombination protein A [Longimicrobiaceae bacterium]